MTVVKANRHRNAGAVIHTHSQAAVLATFLYTNEFKIKNQEMIKGIPTTTKGYLGYRDTLVVPIIENTPHEEDLKFSLEKVITLVGCLSSDNIRPF